MSSNRIILAATVALSGLWALSSFVVMPALVDGYTPFSYPEMFNAIARGDEAGVRYLVQQDANQATRPNRLGQTPLHQAVLYGRISMFDQLTRFGAQLDTQDKTGLTPLHIAALYGRRTCVTWLLDHGAKLDTRDNFGDTPLHTAAIFGTRNIYQLLFDRGADPTLKNNDGRTPRDLAQHYGQHEMLAFLDALPTETTAQ